MSLDREKAKRILDEAYASGKLNRSIVEPDHNGPLGVTDNRCNWCGEPVNAEQTIRELAEALQAITDAYHAPKPWDLTEDELAKWEARLMGAIQRGGHILKKAGY